MVSRPSATRKAAPPDAADGRRGSGNHAKALRFSFCGLVLALALFQLSENTVDVDLWGHIVFGRAIWQTHGIPRTDIYSWTALGEPWRNHECLAEMCLGGMHALMGGPGILLLKVVVGMLSCALALRLGLAGLKGSARLVAWAFAAVAVVEISYGFAARPQIFTALFLVLELMILTRIHEGKIPWALALPFLFVIWVNTHGGVLAGCGLLGLAAAATTAQTIFRRFSQKKSTAAAPGFKIVATLWLSVAAGGAALFCNPWKGELLRWLIGSVLWLRPEIEEWNPAPLSWDHAALFVIILLAAFAGRFTRRERAWWQVAAAGAFALLALRSVRNAPLCGLVLLAVTPTPLASALARFRSHFARVEALAGGVKFQKLAAVICAALAALILVATFTLHKEHPLTMEVPAAEYPTAALAFIEQRGLGGRMLSFFDWGEMVIFHLPECPPSIDGRLDTCYPQKLIQAHWKFYNGEPFDEKVLPVEIADLALLPPRLAGAAALAKRPGWQLVYCDQTAALLVRAPERFAGLAGLSLPVEGEKIAGLGRVPLANHGPRWP